MAQTALSELAGTKMSGKSELWLDPLGNEAKLDECSIEVGDGVVSYSWSFKGKAQQGRIELRDGGATWSDSWHNPEPMTCADVPGSWALIDVTGSYPAGEGPDWGWQTTLSRRPSGELVLQMTNITPWGESGRAVRMVFANA
jgi:hypothetical protein